jgi:FtsP/CotA-like multicopper oxidase with cupredoxin domain
MISRRQFLATGAATAGAVALAPPWSPGPVADEKRRIVLATEPAGIVLLQKPARLTQVWTYGGSVPGPELRVRRGEAFTVRLENGLSQPTSIHWHGIRIDNAMDGVAGLTQDAVPPGGTFDYSFSVPDAGTFWYHPHFRSWEQLARGLYGLLIVEEDEPPAVDRDVAWIADDWRLDVTGLIDVQSFGSLRDAAHQGRLGNWMTINGLTEPQISVRSGERIRLRCVNVANARVMAFDFDRQKLRPSIVAVDGQPVPPRELDRRGLELAPGQRTDLIIDVLEEPSGRIPVYEVSTRKRIETAAFKVQDAPPLRARPLVEPVSLPANPLPRDLSLADAQVIPMLMEGGAMGGLREASYKGKMLDIRSLVAEGKVWSFNGIVGMPEEPLATVPRGRTAVIDMFNQTAWPHAMHLHGHHFRVVKRDGKAVTDAPWRDTVLVARDEKVRIAFIADNPGKWLFHCHMLEHQAAGMVTWIVVT